MRFLAALIDMKARNARLLCILCLPALAACFRTHEVSVLERKPRFGSMGRGGSAAAGGSSAELDPIASSPWAGSFASPRMAAGWPAFAGRPAAQSESLKGALDLLFVIDDSSSMERKQALLRAQIPAMMLAITTGLLDGQTTVTPIGDLHVGVISTDLGVAGAVTRFPGCMLTGDDGLLGRGRATSFDCVSPAPPYLQYAQEVSDRNQLAANVACMADLGFRGCSLQQPLEAALKAVWPMTYIGADGVALDPPNNPFRFLATSNEGTYGHGDTPPNIGFARNTPPEGPSTLAIVIITADEDCSLRNTAPFADSSDPAHVDESGSNMRCYRNKEALFELARYTRGYKTLRPNDEDSVFFGAIVGAPADLVNAEARANVDWSDEDARNAYYDRILNDPRMREQPLHEEHLSIAHLAASCTRTNEDGLPADAYPPRRIVELAKAFGQHAMVQSICQDDWRPMMGAILEHVRSRQ